MLFSDNMLTSNPIPNVLKIPNVTLTLDLSTLDLEHPCEMGKNHELVKDKFLDVVLKWFRPVSSHPEYYYYCSEVTPEVGMGFGKLS